MAEVKYTFCRVCEAACGLKVELENNRIIKIIPNREHVSSGGFACIKGLRFHEIVHSEDRITRPLKRNGGGWEPVSWETALDDIGGKIRGLIDRDGPDSIALYAGNGSGFCLLHTMFAQGFAKALGTRNVYASSTQDCSNKFAVAERMYGFPMLQSVPDFENGEMFIIIGANPAVSKFSFKGVPGILQKLKQAEKNGCRIVSVNPRKTETVHTLGEHLPIRPDTDVFFLLAFAHTLFLLDRKGGGVFNRRHIEKYMKNFDAFEGAVSAWPPERAAEVCGISAETIRELAEAYAGAEGASLYGSTGINHGSHGTAAFWLIEAINGACGNLDRSGGTLVGEGIINFPKLVSGTGAMGSTVHSRIGNLPAVSEALPGAVLADEILTPGKGQIKALFVTAGNPALSIPDTGKMDRALEQLELCVCIDIFPGRTTNYADYILPGITFMEHPDINYIFQSMLGITGTPHLCYSDTVVEPLETQKEETWIFVELCRAAGLPFFGSKFLSFIIETERLLSRLPLLGRWIRMNSNKVFKWVLFASRISSLRKLKREPNGILLPPHKPGSFLGKRVLTSDGLVDLAPADIIDAVSRLDTAFLREKADKNKFKMVNKRETVTHNSYFQNAPSCIRGKRNSNYLYMNPADAAELGLRDGDMARLKNDKGSITLPVRCTEEMMPKSVAVPWGWGHQDAAGLRTAARTGGANPNILTPSGPDSVDPLSGMARLTAITVEIEPA